MEPPNRGLSRGYQRDSPARIHPMIIIGAGEMLTQKFARDNQITHVINCAEDEMCPSWWKNSFPRQYYCIGAFDTIDHDITEWYPEFRRALKTFLQEDDCIRVFVHCQCGINRSAFLALLYVCDVFGYKIETVEASIISQRPCALTNPSFRKQVYAFTKNKTIM